MWNIIINIIIIASITLILKCVIAIAYDNNNNHNHNQCRMLQKYRTISHRCARSFPVFNSNANIIYIHTHSPPYTRCDDKYIFHYYYMQIEHKIISR